MAPPKSAASAIAAENIASSLSSPVSLLWAHQLRREHSVLLAHIEELTNSVNDVSTARLDTLSAHAEKAENRAAQLESGIDHLKKEFEKKTSQLESKHAKLKMDLEQSNRQQQKLEEKVDNVVGRLQTSEQQTQSLQKESKALEKRLSKESSITLSKQEEHYTKQSEQELKIQQLTAKVKELECRLPDTVNEGVLEVKDSMEEMREQIKLMGTTLP